MHQPLLEGATSALARKFGPYIFPFSATAQVMFGNPSFSQGAQYEIRAPFFLSCFSQLWGRGVRGQHFGSVIFLGYPFCPFCWGSTHLGPWPQDAKVASQMDRCFGEPELCLCKVWGRTHRDKHAVLRSFWVPLLFVWGILEEASLNPAGFKTLPICRRRWMLVWP